MRTGTHSWEEGRLNGHGLSSSVLRILWERNPELGVANRIISIAAGGILCQILAAPGMKVFVICEGTLGTPREEARWGEEEKPRPQKEKDIYKAFQSRT